MYDIKPLEEEWERYNKKRKRPLYSFAFILLIIIAAGLVLKNSDIPLLGTDKDHSTVKIQAKDVLVDKQMTELEVRKEKVIDHEISSNVVKPVVRSIPNNNPMDPEDVFVDSNIKVEKRVRAVKKEPVPEVEEKTRSRKKIHFEMIDANAPAAYKKIENRFAFAPDPDDALFLARIYYKNGNYRKAARWALETNKLNGDIEESWLIFARSKAKTGQKNEAIRVLTQYAKKSNSIKAKKLLDRLKK